MLFPLLTASSLLSVPPSCLNKLALTATLRSAHNEPATEWRYGFGTGALGVPTGQLRGSSDEVFPVAHGWTGFLSESIKQSTGIVSI